MHPMVIRRKVFPIVWRVLVGLIMSVLSALMLVGGLSSGTSATIAIMADILGLAVFLPPLPPGSGWRCGPPSSSMTAG